MEPRATLQTKGIAISNDAATFKRHWRVRDLGVFAWRNPIAMAGGIVGFLMVVMAIAAPLIAPYDPLKADFRRMAKAPDRQNFFGTDQIGRDTLSRVIYGARSSLVVAFGAVLLGTTVGSLWGLALSNFPPR